MSSSGPRRCAMPRGKSAAPSPSIATSPSTSCWRSSSASRRSWKRWGSWPAAWPTTSTTCSPSSRATPRWSCWRPRSRSLREYAQEIQYAAARATALTTQLLAFSRRQISQPRVLDLNEVVTHSMKLLRRIIGEDIEVAAHLDPALSKVKVDPVHIDQVIMNLAVNARDAMPRGGRLSIRDRQRLIWTGITPIATSAWSRGRTACWPSAIPAPA